MKFSLIKALALILVGCWAAIFFANSALAAQQGDSCSPNAQAPKGFSCQCPDPSQPDVCTLQADSGSQASSSQGSGNCKKPSFFFFPPWYEYLPLQQDPLGQCSVQTSFSLNDIWAIVLAVVDILLRLAGFVAILSIIISGAQYVFSGGNPENAAHARWRLYNSLIGLAIVAVATALVTFIGKKFT